MAAALFVSSCGSDVVVAEAEDQGATADQSEDPGTTTDQGSGEDQATDPGTDTGGGTDVAVDPSVDTGMPICVWGESNWGECVFGS